MKPEIEAKLRDVLGSETLDKALANAKVWAEEHEPDAAQHIANIGQRQFVGSFLMAAFVWCHSPEGHTFWQDLYRQHWDVELNP